MKITLKLIMTKVLQKGLRCEVILLSRENMMDQ